MASPEDRTYCLTLIRDSGSRCRICAKIYSNNPSLPLGCCAQHNPNNNDDETRLGLKAMLLQDTLRQVRLNLPGADRPLPIPPIAAFSPAQNWWWQTMVALQLFCEIGQTLISPILQSMISNGELNMVRSIEEIKISTHASWEGGGTRMRHCAWLVTMSSGDELVFDPTGIQFSPNWPLISPLGQYLLLNCHEDIRVRNFERRPLGTNFAGNW